MASVIEYTASIPAGLEGVLSKEALEFLSTLIHELSEKRSSLLAARDQRACEIENGRESVGYVENTRSIRVDEWRISGIPSDLMDRRVEITGPANDQKMVINALNSGANVYMADFEDSMSPTWKNVIMGQENIRRAVRRKLFYTSPESKQYSICKKPAVLMARPRGLHLPERHLTLDGIPVPACMADAGLFLYHNAKELLDRGSGPYLYLPKIEHWTEAAWWDTFLWGVETLLQLPPYSIKATVLIETFPAVFQMHEILSALQGRITGLNCGRWDYLFSFIKTMGMKEGFLFPDRSELTMDKPFLTAYSKLLIQTCHLRGAYAMGGMAAQIPNKRDPAADAEARKKVHEDKIREVMNGHDGTWVAHPGSVSDARSEFDARMKGVNELNVTLDDIEITPEMLLVVPKGSITEKGVRRSARVLVHYLASWFRGQGCVPIDYLMEDAATAEIDRVLLWHWIQRRARQEDGVEITPKYICGVINDAAEKLIAKDPSGFDSYHKASELGRLLVCKKTCAPFLTSEAYEILAD